MTARASLRTRLATLIALFAAAGIPLAAQTVTAHPTAPHVVRGENTTTWYPAAGYSWVRPSDSTDLSVQWTPGKLYWHLGSITRQHVMASNTEGKWMPSPGYEWDRPEVDASLEVHWKPGKEYVYLGTVKWPHIIASKTEGTWLPEPGYAWDDAADKENLRVHWKPGLKHYYLGEITQPNIVSSSTEGSWIPAPSYKWAHLDSLGRPVPGDFAVVLDSARMIDVQRQSRLNSLWLEYLREIEADRAYDNWKSPPVALFKARHPGAM